MIGNDIVDLQLVQKENNWRRPRFLQKIFTQEEQDFISAASNKERAVWWLWSKKESVYKIVARLKKRRSFAPKKLVNLHLSKNFISSFLEKEGQVAFEEYRFSTKSVVTESYIHTVARLSNSREYLTANCFYLAQSDYAAQHRITRQHLLANYAELTNLSAKELTIQKDEWRIPHLYYKNKKQLSVISITHHGHYGGYVITNI